MQVEIELLVFVYLNHIILLNWKLQIKETFEKINNFFSQLARTSDLNTSRNDLRIMFFKLLSTCWFVLLRSVLQLTRWFDSEWKAEKVFIGSTGSLIPWWMPRVRLHLPRMSSSALLRLNIASSSRFQSKSFYKPFHPVGKLIFNVQSILILVLKSHKYENFLPHSIKYIAVFVQ